MALSSNYLQELMEAYVLPYSLCSDKDHPLSTFHLSLTVSQVWTFASFLSPYILLTNFQHNHLLL